jgi:hypothetical protein
MLLMAPSLIDSEKSSSIKKRQPFHADRMGVVQIDYHRGDGVAERRSSLQSGRGVGGHLLAAAGATTAEQAHPGHMRLIGGNSMRS